MQAAVPVKPAMSADGKAGEAGVSQAARSNDDPNDSVIFTFPERSAVEQFRTRGV